MSRSAGSGSGPKSSVANRETPISKDDLAIVDGSWSTRYFQSRNAFDVNASLREAAKAGIPWQEQFKQDFGDRADAEIRLVKAMDRNMQPLDDDIRVLRKAGPSFMSNLISQANLPEGVVNRLLDACNGFRKFEKVDVMLLNDTLSGAKFKENAFVSTTYNMSMSDAAFTGRAITLDIGVKKGTKAMFSPTGEESELVLNRNVGHTIKRFEIERGGYKLRVVTSAK